MKIIATIPVRNERWIIERTLRAVSAFCDVVIVVDQKSTDGSRDIYHQFEKVVVINNPSSTFSEVTRNRMMLEAVRNFDGKNLVITLDADEIPTATILDPSIWSQMIDQIKPGMGVTLPWPFLWRDPLKYRDDSSVLSNNWKHFIYWDDRTANFEDRVIHQSRIPEAISQRAIRFNDIKVLHYAYVVWERTQSRCRWYRCFERITFPYKTTRGINEQYSITHDERDLRTSPVPREWIQPWLDRGIDLKHFRGEPLIWQEIRVMQWFQEYGLKYFADLRIWDVDWEEKRQLALAQGIEGLPTKPIHDPRNLEQKLYHAYLDRNLSTPLWRRSREEIFFRVSAEVRGITQKIPGARLLYRKFIKSHFGG